jgi:hypothetical protein
MIKVLDTGERLMVYYVVGCLDIEALLDLGVRGYQEVDKNEGRD